MTRIEHPEFTVDTGLFRQLGELLVGRDSTALVELVKNSYDADATSVVLRGEMLDNPEAAVISVSDDGAGMTADQFRRGFLRLAARGKTEGERRSALYRRRYTGEKGVGRLAAHKLAALVEVTTVAAIDHAGLPFTEQSRSLRTEATSDELLALIAGADRTLVLAQLDWDLIEAVDTLSQVSAGLVLETGEALRSAPTGTTLRLSRLRHAWTSSDLRDLVRQLNNFEPPPSLVKPLPRSVLPKTLIFGEPIVRDADRNDPGLTLEFDGEFANPEEFWGNVIRTADWVLEIRSARGKDIVYRLAPTQAGSEANPFAQAITTTRPHPEPTIGPFFDARILLRPGQSPTTEASWTELNSGIRVYLEGFRILPYGEPRNDWLSLDFDYTKRAGRFQIDPLLGGAEDDLAALRGLASRDVSLRLLPNRAFFGAVFLTEAGAGGLRTLVNREGFVPDDAHNRLVDLVTVGVRLLLRSHALASYKQKALDEANKRETKASAGNSSTGGDEGDNEPANGAPTTEQPEPGIGISDDDQGFDPSGDGEGEDGREWTVLGASGSRRGSASRVQAAINELKELVSVSSLVDDLPLETKTLNYDPATRELQIRQAVHAVEDAVELLVEDASLLRVLASVGSQLAAFTHELSLLVPTAVAAEKALAPVQGMRWPPPAAHARRAVADLRRAVERQASYLLDVTSTEGRRRRSRQPIRERVDSAFLGFQGAAAARQVDLVNAVVTDLKTPPVFKAELQAVLTNLLSNAIKAAATPGRVQVGAEQLPNGVRIVVQNDGAQVRPSEAETWFTPYASTTTEVDLVLGQGMGLGLPITRDLVAEYGGTVRFVPPGDGFSTAVEVVLPE